RGAPRRWTGSARTTSPIPRAAPRAAARSSMPTRSPPPARKRTQTRPARTRPDTCRRPARPSWPRSSALRSHPLDGLEEDAQVLVEQNVGIEHDRAPGDLPSAVHPAQHVLATAGEDLVVGLQMRAIDQERGPRLHLAPGQRRHLEVADQVAGARRRILGPGHPGVEAGHPHLEVALVLLENG